MYRTLETLERLGYVKEADWVEFRIKVPEEHLPRLARLRKRVEENNDLEVVVILRQGAFHSLHHIP